jgi:hypothetical protein
VGVFDAVRNVTKSSKPKSVRARGTFGQYAPNIREDAKRQVLFLNPPEHSHLKRGWTRAIIADTEYTYFSGLVFFTHLDERSEWLPCQEVEEVIKVKHHTNHTDTSPPAKYGHLRNPDW